MTARHRAPGYRIEASAQIAALASPARQEIVDAAVASGPFTVAQIARRLGRPADALYFHVRQLEHVGLLRRSGERGNGRSRAGVYDLPGRPLRIPYGPRPQRAGRIGPVIDGILRLARRDASRALARRDAVVEGPARDTWGARARGWLGEPELRRVNRLLAQAFDLIHAGAPRPGTKPVALVFALTPLEARAESRRRPGSAAKPLKKAGPA